MLPATSSTRIFNPRLLCSLASYDVAKRFSRHLLATSIDAHIEPPFIESSCDVASNICPAVHSGITAEQMRGVTTSLEDVQRDVLEMVAAETILIGHSLENDLTRLRIMHATCVDTVALYPHQR